MLGCLESQVYKLREEQNVKRVYKLVDTCAAEFTAITPYYYSTFEADIEKANGERYVHNDSIVTNKKKVVVLGSGQLLYVVLGQGDVLPRQEHHLHDLGVARHFLLVTGAELLDLKV